MSSTMEKIKQLREETSAGMMDVKRALEESDGDLDGARKSLKEKGKATAAKKSAREVHEGLIGSYIHFNGKVGVLVEVDCETDFVARTDQFKDFVKNVALHVASMNPLCVAPEDIPEDQLAEERSAVEKQAAEMGKPESVTQKIVDGRMDKWIAERALLTQPYVKEEEKTVGELLQETVAVVGENVVIRRFVRYEL